MQQVRLVTNIGSECDEIGKNGRGFTVPVQQNFQKMKPLEQTVGSLFKLQLPKDFHYFLNEGN